MKRTSSAVREGAADVMRSAGLEAPAPRKKPKGKVLDVETLSTPRMAMILDDAIDAHRLDPADLGLRSRAEVVVMVKRSLEALHGSLIAIDDWMGEIWERAGSRHVIVIGLRKELVPHFLAEAARSNATFVDGLGNVRPRSKPFRAVNLHEVSDLRIKDRWQATGSKFCDRATLCINDAGEVLIVLTEEYKTAGVKVADLDEQQGTRNVRLNDSTLTPDAILTFLDADGNKLETFLGDLRLHVENPGNQIGAQARKTSTNVAMRGDVYYHQHVPWPGGPTLRRVLETVLATLPKAK